MSMWKIFGRGFDSRRLHHVLIVLWLLLPAAGICQNDSITVFFESRKNQIPLLSIEGYPYFDVKAFQNYLDYQVHPVVGNQNLSLSISGHTVILSAGRSLVSVDDALMSLSRSVIFSNGVWYVPLDFISKILRQVSDQEFLWLESSRSFMIGDTRPNQVQLRYSQEQEYSRLIFQSNRPVSYTIAREGDVIVVRPQAEDLVPGFDRTDFQDGVIGELTVAPVGARKVFRIRVLDGFATYRSLSLENPSRLVLDFYRKEVAILKEVPTPPSVQPVPPSLLPSRLASKRVIVIDPGHGGSETGAQGPAGTLEKDIVLGIARKLKTIIESNTQTQVILTRNGDTDLSLDDRTAVANNHKADLFVSVHANATIRGYGKGAETYFLSAQATDDAARNSAAVENNAIGLTQELEDDDLKLILWDLAQTEYLTESSQLAETIQQELNTTLGISNRGIKQAPFRVLTGATMPAVLVEVGFINNPEEEKLMKNADYQMMIATALFRSILTFQRAQSSQASHVLQGSN